jgi:hypothetical protein
MPDPVYPRPHGPRLVRTRDGYILTGDVSRVLDATDLLWLRASVEECFNSIVIAAVCGGKGG